MHAMHSITSMANQLWRNLVWFSFQKMQATVQYLVSHCRKCSRDSKQASSVAVVGTEIWSWNSILEAFMLKRDKNRIPMLLAACWNGAICFQWHVWFVLLPQPWTNPSFYRNSSKLLLLSLIYFTDSLLWVPLCVLWAGISVERTMKRSWKHALSAALACQVQGTFKRS